MAVTLDNLTDLYNDSEACARLVGLQYISEDELGIRRQKHGRGFVYYDQNNHSISDKHLKERIAKLVIPPAWQEVWICPSDNGHVLATGIDDKGRKQYIYNPKWRTLRDLIKFYRLLVFAKALPTIRRAINEGLAEPKLTRNKIMATMLWLLDNTYLRVGNEVYFAENESVGLTTLTKKNLVAAGSVSTLSFKGKSGKLQQITFDNQRITDILQQLSSFNQPRLFSYKENDSYYAIESEDINSHLQDLTKRPISAKDFRTWGGTLLAFDHLVKTYKLPDPETPKPDKAVVQSVDAAAAVLGNTRSVAKASYVHPHILQAYAEKNFARYYETARSIRAKTGLDKRETELVAVLEQLFKDEFTLLQSAKD